MADVPPKAFKVDALPEGKLALSMLVDGQEVGRLEGDGTNAAFLAKLLLNYAQATHKAAGLRLPEVTQRTPGLTVQPDLNPSRVEIFRNPGEQRALLIMTFGQAQISIAIPGDFLSDEPPERPDQMH